MAKCRKVIFICTDNTGRSIMAEAVMKQVCGNQLQVCSRGIVVLFPEPLNPMVLDTLQSCGLTPPKEYSEEFNAADLEEGTLILTMTESERDIVRTRLGVEAGIYTLGEFTDTPGDIEIPHGCGFESYKACCEYIDFLAKVAAEKLLRNNK